MKRRRQIVRHTASRGRVQDEIRGRPGPLDGEAPDRRKERRAFLPGEQGVGRIEQDEVVAAPLVVRRGPQGGIEGVPRPDVHALRQPESEDVCTQDFEGRTGALDRDHECGAATGGLQPETAAAGEQVEHPRPFDRGAQAPEQRLPHAVEHRPRREPLRGGQTPSPACAGDDPHGRSSIAPARPARSLSRKLAGATVRAMPRLHVNVDHVATLRQARREAFPDPIEWALEAERAGALGITCHLRQDRRHIQDADVAALRARITTRLNLELSLAPEIVAIALESGADAFCIVPEGRKEVTTEGGLDVARERDRLREAVPRLAERGGEVSLFVDPEPAALEGAAEVGALFVELHTGRYANARGSERERELERLVTAADRAHALGLRVNAGHGLDYENVAPVARLPHVEELNIGFAIVARAVFTGVRAAVGDMLRAIEEAQH